MVKDKKTMDLIWILPEFFGSLGICAFALIYLSRLDVEVLGLVSWVFNLSLVMLVVLEIGLKGVCKSIDEFFNVKFIKNYVNKTSDNAD